MCVCVCVCVRERERVWVCQHNSGCEVATYSLSEGSIPTRGDTSEQFYISRGSLLVGEAGEM